MILDSQFLAIFFQLPASGEKKPAIHGRQAKDLPEETKPTESSTIRVVLCRGLGEGSLIEVAISEDKSIGAKKSVTNLSSL